MSTNSTSVPPWKQSLLDKKRRQDEENRRLEKDEVERLSSLPPWKLDLLIKRQGQKNSMVFVGRRKSSSESPERKPPNKDEQNLEDLSNLSSNQCDTVSENHNNLLRQPVGNGDKEEHLLPVKDNPWLKSDPVVKKRLSDNIVYHRSHSHDREETHHSSWSGDTHVLNDVHNDGDDVFEEEVAYGKGFVHKLLRKFSHMGEERGRKWSKTSSNRRYHSAENLLDDTDHSTTRRESSPCVSCSDSLSPRSPSRSRSGSIPSPRVPSNNENTQVANKISYADKPCVDTSVSNSKDKVQGPHVINSSASLLLSPSGESILVPEDEKPKKNIVSSTRNVFEKIVSPRNKKPAPVAPKPVRSPRNSVHTLIAIENLDSEAPAPSLERSSESISNGDLSNQNKENCSTDDFQSKVSKQSQNGIDVSEKKLDSNFIINNQEKITVQHIQDNNLANNISSISDTKCEENNTSSAPSYFDLYAKASSRSGNEANKSSESSSRFVNCDSSHSVNDETDTSLVVTSPTHLGYKKRRAPLPPKPSRFSDKSPTEKLPPNPSLEDKPSSPKSNYSVDTSPGLTNSTIKTNGVLEIEFASDLTQGGVALSENRVLSKSKQGLVKKPHVPVQNKNNAPVNTKPVLDAKRHNLNLNLNEISDKKPEVVKGSKGSSNDAYSVINNFRNKKAKIVTPKSSSGPGSLLIRPASNMIQAKNAQFAKLEFKYDDIRTGDFAPPKKKPSYYDDDSDTDDDDIPVTNIDDLVDTNITGDVRLGLKSKDKNANIAKKGGKYEFIGAGVICGKSSLSKKRKAVKMSLTFDEHNCFTYEYPSEQSLMSGTPPRPGDYDYIDTTTLNGVHDSDTDDDESMTIDVEKVTTKSLKSNPVIGSTGSLSGYQSKMQFEYHFGMNMNEEPAPPPTKKVVQTEMTENECIKPADEDGTANWSETQSSDLLF